MYCDVRDPTPTHLAKTTSRLTCLCNLRHERRFLNLLHYYRVCCRYAFLLSSLSNIGQWIQGECTISYISLPPGTTIRFGRFDICRAQPIKHRGYYISLGPFKVVILKTLIREHTTYTAYCYRNGRVKIIVNRIIHLMEQK